MKISILAIGRLKSGPLLTLCEDYQKRLAWSVNIEEIPFNRDLDAVSYKRETARLLVTRTPSQALKIILDERGEVLTSPQFSKKIESWGNAGQSHLAFLIGGSEGLDPDLIDPHAFRLSLGKATWPHLLVRVLLLEQLYRAQQIIKGHPYHK